MGILISHYFNINKKKKFRKLLTFRDIQSVIKKLESIKDKFTNSQIFRIFSYLLRAKIQYKNESEILLLSEEKNDSAFLLAQNFIIEEIDNLMNLVNYLLDTFKWTHLFYIIFKYPNSVIHYQ